MEANPALSTSTEPRLNNVDTVDTVDNENHAPAIAVEASALSEAPLAADLPQRRLNKRWLLLCFAVTFLIYIVLIPQFLIYSNPPTGDQAFYLMETISLAQDFDLNLANNYANKDEDKFYALAPKPPGFVGMSAPYPLGAQLAHTTRPEQEQYPFHPPGMPVLLMPSWIAGGWFSLWWPATIIFMCGIGALVAVNVFLLAHELTGKLWIAIAVWLPIAFSNPVMTFSYMLFTELTAGLLVIYAFRRLALGWGANNKWRLLVVGLCIAYLPWIAWRCIFISAALALYAAVQWWRYYYPDRNPNPFRFRRSSASAPKESDSSAEQPVEQQAEQQARGIKRSLLPALWILVPTFISGILIVSYDLFLFSTITPNNRMPEDGREALFHWPWLGGDHFTLFMTGAFGQLFDRQYGLLPYAPFYILSVVGMIAMFRSARRGDRNLLLWIGLLAVPYMIVLTAFFAWNGVWSPPARYLTTFVPLMAAPLAMSLYVGSRLYKTIYGLVYTLMALPAIALMSVRMIDARLFWPGDIAQFFGWLAYSEQSPVKIDVVNYLPDFVWTDDLRQPANTGWMITASIVIVLVFYLLMLTNRKKQQQAQAQLQTQKKLPYTTHGLIWLVSIAAIGGGWYTINREYIQHRTVLTEQARWIWTKPMPQPYGLAYLDGKLYVGSYISGTVTALDMSTGSYTPVQPVSGTKTLNFSHVGDLRVGPDNLLYVLDNDTSGGLMYAMKPSGTVMRQIPLNGRSNVGIGFQFGSDGLLYVTDMIVGAVLKYKPEGGDAVGGLRGMVAGFNNVAGVAIDKDGTVYAAETGESRVQQINAQGQFVQKFDLKCVPEHLAIYDDWVDVTCDKGLRTIDKRTGAVQRYYIMGKSQQLIYPTGLTYGPDGTLYILDPGAPAVIAYKVEH